MHWSDRYTREEFIHELRKLARMDGVSAAEAAKRIGLDVTKSMVLGLANRVKPKIQFGEPDRPRSAPPGPKVKAAPKPKKPPAPKKPVQLEGLLPISAPLWGGPRFVILGEVEDDDAAVHLLKMPHHGRCRFPLWPDRIGSTERLEGEEMMFCGKPTKHQKPYCKDHQKLAYRESANVK